MNDVEPHVATTVAGTLSSPDPAELGSLIAGPGDSGSMLLARFERLPVWPYPRSVLWLIGAGYFFGFFDILTIGVALPRIAEHFHVSTTVAAVSISTSLAGYVVGALAIGTLSDRFGRRIGLYCSLGCFTLGSLLSALSPSMAFLDAARFLTGIGIGAEIAVVSTYLSELAPVRVRGRMAAKAGLFAAVAQVSVPLLARWLVPDYAAGWRILFLVGATGGLVTLVLRLKYNLPITLPRLVAGNRHADAERLVADAEQRAELVTGRPLPQPAETVPRTTTARFPITELFTAPYLRRTILMLSVWFVFYIGNYGWLTLAPTLLVQKGFGLKGSLEIVTVAGFGIVAGALLGTFVNDRMERKFTATIALAVWGATMVGIGLFPLTPVVMIIGFVSNTALGLVIFLMYIYTAENFPAACRTTGVALTDGLGHIGGALAPFVVLSAQHIYGFTGAFVTMGLCGALAAMLLVTGIRTSSTESR